MERIQIAPRENWQAKVEYLGFLFHTIKGEPYWDESAYYRFTRDEADVIADATRELHQMCLEAIDYVISGKFYSRFSIPEWFVPELERSWEQKDPTLYGRFDFAYDGKSPPKMLEYNADTAISLVETSVVQWEWMREVLPEQDQFNPLHDLLVARWKELQSELEIDAPVYFSCMKGSDEDLGNIHYLMNAAAQAGLETQRIFIEDIGWNDKTRRFIGNNQEEIKVLFKMYPWEWMLGDRYGKYLVNNPIRVMEPAWKILLSSKGILPILWKLFPGHENLLPTYTHPHLLGDSYVVKPLYSREGANITIHDQGNTITSTCNKPDDMGYIYQAYNPLPQFEGNYTVVGSWVIGDEPAGLSVREDATPIIQHTSRFMPHIVE